MENIELKLPSGATATIKPFVTAREKRSLRDIMLKFSEVTSDGASTKNLGEAANAMEDAAIKLLVVSLNGSSENIVERVLDLRSDDFDFLKKELDKTTTGERFLG